MSLQAQPLELPLSGVALTELTCAVLARGASFRFRAKGSSMSPFIRNGDVVTVSPSPATGFAPGDIAAFAHGESDRLVIHRVVAIQGASFIARGDNASDSDGLIPYARVLGRVTRVERSGRSLRLGLGPERRLIAFCSRTSLLSSLLAPLRKISRYWRLAVLASRRFPYSND